MVKRWLGYLTVWLSCLILFFMHRQWASCIIFVAVTALPPVSLLLMRPVVRSAQVHVNIPEHVTRGEEAVAAVSITCKSYQPLWHTKMVLRHSFSGATQRLKPYQSLPTDHCGTLHISMGSVYVCDPLGLFRFRIIGPQQFFVAVRPEPAAPEALPELGNKVSTVWRPRRGGGFSENHDLRLYRPGDDLRQIHWKLSAKSGSLILREPLEALHSRLLLRLDLMGSPAQLDAKLSLLLWVSRYLLSKKLSHHWQIHTASGTETLAVTSEEDLLQALDALLRMPPATEGSVLQQSANAAWWYYIGGDSHEES